jgi:transposase-like protein
MSDNETKEMNQTDETQDDETEDDKRVVNMKCKRRGPQKQLSSCGNMTAYHEVIPRDTSSDLNRYRCTECGSTWTIAIGHQLDI